MYNIGAPLVNVFFAYQLSYIPRSHRKIRTCWCPGKETIALRLVSQSVMTPAFRIERRDAKSRLVTEIFRYDSTLWWPIVSRLPCWDKQLFFNALERGIPAALEAISIDILWAGKPIKDFDPFFVGRIVRSTEQEMQTMAARAAHNLILVDDEHLFIRGGEPIWVTPRDLRGAPSHLCGEIANSGALFGSALPLNPISPADETGLTTSNINAAAIEGRTDGIVRAADRHPIYDIRIFEDYVPSFDPIDFQVRACLRELSRQVQQALIRAKLSQDVRQSALIFTDCNQHIDHTTAECTDFLRAFLEWYRYLPLKQGYKFRGSYDLVRTCIAAIGERCRCERRKSPLEHRRLEPAEDEALSLLCQ